MNYHLLIYSFSQRINRFENRRIPKKTERGGERWGLGAATLPFAKGLHTHIRVVHHRYGHGRTWCYRITTSVPWSRLPVWWCRANESLSVAGSSQNRIRSNTNYARQTCFDSKYNKYSPAYRARIYVRNRCQRSQRSHKAYVIRTHHVL